MKTEAQKRAENNYRKKLKQLVIRFYPNERDEAVYEWLKAQKNTTEYVKNLVFEDMQNSR